VQASAVPETPPATGLRRPVIVGHRGWRGYRPEHTAADYELAIELGADVFEPDMQLLPQTRYGVRPPLRCGGPLPRRS
jgi:glycerophosphoryl diester phosphodiesterase